MYLIMFLLKIFNRLMYSQIKTKNVHKKHFCMSCLQNVTSKEISNSHRERCLLINKQIPIPFKIYKDSEF